MNTELKICLLGMPSILKDQLPVVFPYRQAEAVFYYLVIHKAVNRKTLAGLIWEDSCTEEKLNANLRNAFYIIRKTLGKDFIQKESGSIIRISPEYDLRLDTDQFLKASAPLSLYRGDFLDGFYLKNNTQFNSWVSNTRQMYKSLYLNRLQDSIRESYRSKDYTLCESLCKQQISINEFDETAYKYLMHIYSEKKQYAQALQIYNHLEELLTEELFETPGDELQKLAASIEEGWSKNLSHILEGKKALADSLEKSRSFYGRKKEMGQIKSLLSQPGSSQHVLVTGEAGIGKTRLINTVLDSLMPSRHFLLLATQCYYAEESYILKPWHKPVQTLIQYLSESDNPAAYSYLIQSIWTLFPFTREHWNVTLDTDDISTYDYRSIQSIFINSCIHFSFSQPVIFYFDDLQWADSAALSLLRNFITSLSDYENPQITFLFTCRNDCSPEVQSFINGLVSQQKLTKISLHPFTFRETLEMAQTLYPEYVFTEDTKKEFFRATDGNPFFITEAVNNLRYNVSPTELTPKIRNILQQRIEPLPEECRKILDFISVFFDGISFRGLSLISRKDDFELVEILEYLLNQNLLKESKDQNNTFFSFTHQKILDYVYDEMSWTKKRVLHSKAGCYYETLLQNNSKDMALYPKLIYHFERSADHEKYLKYSVKYLYHYLNVTHEFFPVMEKNLTLFNLNMKAETQEQLSDDLTDIERLLGKIESKVNSYSEAFLFDKSGENSSLEIHSEFLHMIGRHYIRTCHYDRGLVYINKLKALNSSSSSASCMEKKIQANRQLICVYINRYEPEKMGEVIRDSFSLIDPKTQPEELAVWKRLDGLRCIMRGNLSDGRKNLIEAIKIFNHSQEKEKHLYNLAAAYSWIGESYRHLKRYTVALACYKKAISICSGNFLVSGIAIFYAYGGMAALESGDCSLAEKYLNSSLLHYERGNLMWGRSLPHSYKALLFIQKENFPEAFRYLQLALSYARKLESRYETGIVYRIYAQIKAYSLKNTKLQKLAAAELPHSFSFYCRTALSCFEGVYSPGDIEILNSLINENQKN